MKSDFGLSLLNHGRGVGSRSWPTQKAAARAAKRIANREGVEVFVYKIEKNKWKIVEVVQTEAH